MLAANVVSTDTLLALWETLAVFAFVAAWHANRTTIRDRYCLLMWLSFGAAFLTKGPPGLLPLLSIVSFNYLFLHRHKRLPIFKPAHVIAFLALASSWYVIVIAREPALWRYFAGYEFVDRIFSTRHNRNGEWYGALYVYVPVLLVGTLPWLPVAVAKLRRRKRHSVRRTDLTSYFLLLWLFLPLSIFFLARSRLPLYVLPLFVPLSILMARILQRRLEFSSRAWRTFIVILPAVILALKAYPAHIDYNKDARAMAHAINLAFDVNDYDEIVFYETTPFYGLVFYLDKGVEIVRREINESEVAGLYETQSLADSIRHSVRTLYLMPPGTAPEFQATLQAVEHQSLGTIANVRHLVAATIESGGDE